MEYLKRFFIGIVLAGSMLLSLTVHAFDIEGRNIICQSETETETQTEAPSEESTEKPKETPEGKPEEEDPEDDCD
jgi:hypothetical protein